MPNVRQREYHERTTKAIQSLLNAAPTVQEAEHAVEEQTPPTPPNSGTRIGRYINAQHFGNGLFSEVLKAILPDSQSINGQPAIMALKITTPHIMKPPHNAIREARILGALEGNERTIPLIETFQQPGGRFVMAFPFMSHDLGGLLYGKQLNDKSRRSILKDIFSGLMHIHNLGIIHRDVKPSNILLPSASGPAYVSDFGIAWSASDPASESAHEKILDVGTTCYRPPELLFGNQAYSTGLDLWAAGCVVAQVVCLNGQTLFDAGELGSELALIKSIFETLGTPNLEVWPVS